MGGREESVHRSSRAEVGARKLAEERERGGTGDGRTDGGSGGGRRAERSTCTGGLDVLFLTA